MQVVAALTPAVQPAFFKTLSPEAQYEVVAPYARSLFLLGRTDAAHAAFQVLTTLPKATADDWNYRYRSAKWAADARDAWVSFKHLEVIASKDARHYDVDEALRSDRLFTTLPNAQEARASLRGAVERWGEPPLIPWDDPSWLALRWAADLLERGDAAHAAEVAQSVVNPLAVAVLRSDRRFDAMVARDSARFDVATAADRWIGLADQEAAKFPSLMQAQLLTVTARITADRLNEALDRLDAIFDRARKSHPLSGEGYEDAAQQ
jgi:hypothetical protein